MVKTTNNIFVLLDRSDKMKMHDPRYRRAEDTIVDTFLHLLRQNSLIQFQLMSLPRKRILIEVHSILITKIKIIC